MRWTFLLGFGLGCGLGACASARSGGGDSPTDGQPSADDAAPPIDAVPIDAPPQPAMLSQNTNTSANGNSFNCNQSNFTRDNSYYRVFALSEHGVANQFQVQMVTFSVQTANAGGVAVSQAAQVKIGRYLGAVGTSTLDLTQVMPVNSASIMIPDSGAALVNVPITGVIPSGNLIVELAIPDGLAAQNVLFVGTNAAGESRPGYIRSATCSITTPTSMNVIGAQQSLPKADLIMTVSGLKY